MNWIITISDYHNTDGEFEKSELTTEAEVVGISSDYLIKYDEQSDELKGCSTTVHVTNGCCIDISRQGKYTTQMTIDQGKRNQCCYATPLGQLTMGVYATKVSSVFKENEMVNLDFTYTLDFNNNLISKNRLIITAKHREAK